MATDVARADGEVPAPPQWQAQPIYDFRHAADGPRGYKINVTKRGNAGTKRKLEEYSEQHPEKVQYEFLANFVEQVEREEAEAAMAEGDPAAAPIGTVKRPKHNTLGVGKTSGRTWKAPATRTSKPATLSSSWEKKMKVKAEEDAYKARKRDATEARKAALREDREKREAARLRKEENRKKSVITTRISTATAKRMAKNKKLAKKLVTVDG